MITINGIKLPNFLMNEREMLQSLKIGSVYLRKLEVKGLPYVELDETHVYDPNKVWKWYLEYRRGKE